MSIINLFKRNKQPILRPMDDNIYGFTLYRIPKNIKIDTSLSRKANILRADETEVDEILGQVLVTPKNFWHSETKKYVRELATGKLIPVHYIERNDSPYPPEYKTYLEYIEDLSPIYVRYIEYISMNYRGLFIGWDKCTPGEEAKERNAKFRREHLASLEEIKKYLQERRPNEDASVYLAKLNEYFEQAEEYYRLAENKKKEEEEKIKQIVKSINNR